MTQEPFARLKKPYTPCRDGAGCMLALKGTAQMILVSGYSCELRIKGSVQTDWPLTFSFLPSNVSTTPNSNHRTRR